METDSKLNILAEQGSSSQQNDSSSEYDSGSSDEESATVSTNLNENYEDEIEIAFANCRKKKATRGDGSKRRRNRSKIPIHLKGLMGEANLRFARNDLTTAESMCLEVIRHEPRAYEPYQTLSQIYEKRDKEKSIEFLTIAAHLHPYNVDQWVTLGEHFYQVKNNIRGAVTCLTHAIRAQPRNYELHLRRIALLESIGDLKFVLRCKVYLLQNYSKKCPNEIIALAKELTTHYHKTKEYTKAVEAYSIIFTKCRKLVTPEMVNIYLELLLQIENYAQCLDTFVQFCNIEMEVYLIDEGHIQVLSYSIPENIEIDLRIKFIMCLVKLDGYELIKNLIELLIEDEDNVERNGDLFLDVAEALMSKAKFMEALQLLVPLIKSRNFSLAAVWLKYAECLKECNMNENAVDAYYQVIRLAPFHLEVRHPLSKLLVDLNRMNEAMTVLKHDMNPKEVDVELVIKEMSFALKLGRMTDYFNAVELFLSRHCVIFNHKDELRLVTYQENVSEKIARINRQRELKGEEEIKMNIISLREPSIEAEYAIYKEILSYCYKNKYYNELKKFAFYGLCSHRFKLFVHEITIVGIYACILTRDTKLAFPIIRDLLVRRSKANHKVWNLFNIAMQNAEEMRQTRFLMRQGKSRKFDFMKVLQSCVALTSGSYRIASIYLMPYLKQQPTPYIYLLLGVTFLQISCQKHREMKKKMTQYCYGFFANYANNRGKAALQEVYYNLGRMYHQYGILHLAAHYYKAVLAFRHPMMAEHPDILDLKQEAAYNLHIIYKESENYVAARNIVLQYLTI